MFESGVQMTEVSFDLTEIRQRTRQIGRCGGPPTEVYGCDEIASGIVRATLAARLECVCYEILKVLWHCDREVTTPLYPAERRLADFFLALFLNVFPCTLGFCDFGEGAFAATIS